MKPSTSALMRTVGLLTWIAPICLALGQAKLSTSITAPAAQTPWKRQPYKVPIVSTPPKIDGVLDDACWKDAIHAEGFFRFQSQEGIQEQTEAWICADRKNLYIAFHCLDSHPELIKASETQREGNLNHDDWVGLAIDSQSTRKNASQIMVSPIGTQVTQLEGGTADNRKWSGDWKAATTRTKDGWIAEMEIPFQLFRYPKGTRSFPIILLRQIARETNAECWPYMPPESFNNPIPFLQDFVGVEPPFQAPKLVVLPYELSTVGDGKPRGRFGADLKYPLTTGLTGVATLFPDFQTVEQAVTDLSFSYTEKYVPDRRPFFAEGGGFSQDSFLFYSQRIPTVDEGIKVVGKEGPTTVGVLGTNTSQDAAQKAIYASVDRDLGAYSSFGGSFLRNQETDEPGNQVAQLRGQYGWVNGKRSSNLYGNLTESWVNGGDSDQSSYLRFHTHAGPRQLNGNFFYASTGPNFTNQLGLVSETDTRGYGADIWEYDVKDRGRVEQTSVEFYGESYRHVTGGFFHDFAQLNGFLAMRNGWQYNLAGDFGKRDDYHDNTLTTGVSWNQKSLVEGGGVNLQVGRRQNMPYQFASLNQGIKISKAFSLQLGVNRINLGGDANTQTVLSGTYRLGSDRSIGGRLVQQGHDVNAYLSYGQRGRNGCDFFVLIGDPNSSTLRKQVTIKVVHAF